MVASDLPRFTDFSVSLFGADHAMSWVFFSFLEVILKVEFSIADQCMIVI